MLFAKTNNFTSGLKYLVILIMGTLFLSCSYPKDYPNIIKEIIPNVTFEHRPQAQDKPTRGTLKMDKARERLGFIPRWPLDKGYKKYCEWYVSEWEKVVRANA